MWGRGGGGTASARSAVGAADPLPSLYWPCPDSKSPTEIHEGSIPNSSNARWRIHNPKPRRDRGVRRLAALLQRSLPGSYVSTCSKNYRMDNPDSNIFVQKVATQVSTTSPD